MTLYIARHAESEANRKNILAGRVDYPLSDSGRRQARHIAQAFLAEQGLDMLVSSPLIRARKTAEAFAVPNRLPITIREELTEVHIGRFSGMTYDEVEGAEGYVHDRAARWDWVPEGGGESYAMLAQRLEPFFHWLQTRKEKDVLLISHAVTMRLLRAHLELTLPEYPLEIAQNGEIWKLTFSGLGKKHSIVSLLYGTSAHRA